MGEERSLQKLAQELEDVPLYLVGEIKDIEDNKSGLFYTFYRVGQSDSPPHYSAGRVLVRVWSATPPSIGGLFDTEITDIEPFGTIELAKNTGGVLLNCSKESPINITECKYGVSFDKESESLVVKKIK